MIRVLVADDPALVRAGFRVLIDSDSDFEVVGEASRVLMLTTFDLDEYVFAALEGGASGFLLKDTPPADLIAGIRTIAAGEALLARASPGT